MPFYHFQFFHLLIFVKQSENISMESNLLHALLKNDKAGIERLYKEMLPSIKSWVKRNSGNEQDAGDVLQDAIIVVFEKASQPDFKLTGSFKSYLTSVCRFIWLRKLKKNSRTTNHLPTEKEISEDDSIEVILQEEERVALFQKYYNSLNEICKQVLKLFFEGKKMKEIASEMGYAEKFARVKKHMCQKKLISKIQEDRRYRELVLG